MGNASKAQVTKQLDFTIPVDYVGGGGEFLRLVSFFYGNAFFCFGLKKYGIEIIIF